MKDNTFTIEKKTRILINSGVIFDIKDLFNVMPKSYMAKILELNPVSFTNRKSNQPESFKLGELIKISDFIEVDLIDVVKIFNNSIQK